MPRLIRSYKQIKGFEGFDPLKAPISLPTDVDQLLEELWDLLPSHKPKRKTSDDTSPARGEPHRNLLAAVLTQAISDYVDKGSSKKLARNAKGWLFFEMDTTPFSFDHICNILGYDKTSLRKQIVKFKSGEASWGGCSRPRGIPSRPKPGGA